MELNLIFGFFLYFLAVCNASSLNHNERARGNTAPGKFTAIYRIANDDHYYEVVKLDKTATFAMSVEAIENSSLAMCVRNNKKNQALILELTDNFINQQRNASFLVEEMARVFFRKTGMELKYVLIPNFNGNNERMLQVDNELRLRNIAVIYDYLLIDGASRIPNEFRNVLLVNYFRFDSTGRSTWKSSWRQRNRGNFVLSMKNYLREFPLAAQRPQPIRLNQQPVEMPRPQHQPQPVAAPINPLSTGFMSTPSSSVTSGAPLNSQRQPYQFSNFHRMPEDWFGFGDQKISSATAGSYPKSTNTEKSSVMTGALPNTLENLIAKPLVTMKYEFNSYLRSPTHGINACTDPNRFTLLFLGMSNYQIFKYGYHPDAALIMTKSQLMEFSDRKEVNLDPKKVVLLVQNEDIQSFYRGVNDKVTEFLNFTRGLVNFDYFIFADNSRVSQEVRRAFARNNVKEIYGFRPWNPEVNQAPKGFVVVDLQMQGGKVMRDLDAVLDRKEWTPLSFGNCVARLNAVRDPGNLTETQKRALFVMNQKNVSGLE